MKVLRCLRQFSCLLSIIKHVTGIVVTWFATDYDRGLKPSWSEYSVYNNNNNIIIIIIIIITIIEI